MNIENIKQTINNNPLYIFVLSLVPVIFYAVSELQQSQNIFTFEIANPYYYLMLILISFKVVFTNKLSYFDILCALIIYTIIDISGLYVPISYWITHESILRDLFFKLPAPGTANVISALLLCITTVSLLSSIIYQYYKHKRTQLIKIFISLCSLIVLGTFYFFHIISFEMDYRWHENREIKNAETILKNKSDKDFFFLCKHYKYECSTDDSILNKLNKDEYKIVSSIPKNNDTVKIMANIGKYRYNGYQERVGIFKYKNRWLIDFNNLEEEWSRTSQKFFLLTFIAHTFWIYFTMFLIFSHLNRRKNKQR